ncbi:hypothetical protein [Bacillus coahuilensis]|uniref:hypothetical protein n=1 Tax=Bacillus coahuilensis TaxID=408580 RepID=UPI0007502294|nr:hypothetical protein [Bacillus coahuilensis]
MHNSLYFRVIITFIFVVVISVTTAFSITFNHYQERILNEFEQEMIEAGKGMIQLQKSMGQEGLEGYLAGVSTITFNIALYSEDGDVKVFGPNKESVLADPADVQKVLNGGIYRVDEKEKD